MGWKTQHSEYNNVITSVTDGYYIYHGWMFCNYVNVESLCCTSETNVN